MKFLLGTLTGTLLTLLSVYGLLTYSISEYIVTEKVLSSSEWQNSLATLQNLQEQLKKYSEEKKDLCQVICQKSSYWESYGQKPANKVRSLERDLQARGKASFKDPGFLLDLLYVNHAMFPIEQAGFFSWLKSVPAEVSPQWNGKANLSSDLALTAPRLLWALQSVQDNLRILFDLRELRNSCTPKNHSEIQSSCAGVLGNSPF